MLNCATTMLFGGAVKSHCVTVDPAKVGLRVRVKGS
jgi:hypothetical protein